MTTSVDSARPVAIVSGGSRGIGRAICVSLAEAGYAISYCYSTENKATNLATKELCEKQGVPVLAQKCDVSSAEDCKAWFSSTIRHFGRADLLVNNSGINADSPLVNMSDDAWKSVIDVNLSGAFNLTRAAIFHFMKSRSGAIVNISSVSGVYGNATQANYAASKAGLIGFSKSVAKEVAGYGIRVNVVAPGFIETDMTSAMTEKAGAAMLAKIPLKRLGQPEDVGAMVRFLASDAAGYVTGQVFHVDGGITL